MKENTKITFQITSLHLLSVNFKQQYRKIIFKALTAINCPLKALDRSTYASLRNPFHSYLTRLGHRTPKKITKLQRENQNYISNYDNSESEPKKTRAIPLKLFLMSLDKYSTKF